MLAHTPNILTILRVVLTVVAIAIIPFAPVNLYTYLLGIFIVAALTDFLDGYIARRFSIESDFGKIFDPLSDKVLTFVFLVILYPTGVIAPTVILLLIVRDLVVDGVRASLASYTVIPAIFTAKVKTTLIFLLIISALIELSVGTSSILRQVTVLLSAAALVFAYVSATQYAQLFYRAYQSRTSE